MIVTHTRTRILLFVYVLCPLVLTVDAEKVESINGVPAALYQNKWYIYIHVFLKGVTRRWG